MTCVCRLGERSSGPLRSYRRSRNTVGGGQGKQYISSGTAPVLEGGGQEGLAPPEPRRRPHFQGLCSPRAKGPAFPLAGVGVGCARAAFLWGFGRNLLLHSQRCLLGTFRGPGHTPRTLQHLPAAEIMGTATLRKVANRSTETGTRAETPASKVGLPRPPRAALPIAPASTSHCPPEPQRSLWLILPTSWGSKQAPGGVPST